MGQVFSDRYPDNKVHGANMGPTLVLSAQDGPLVGPMNLAIRVAGILSPQEHQMSVVLCYKGLGYFSDAHA